MLQQIFQISKKIIFFSKNWQSLSSTLGPKSYAKSSRKFLTFIVRYLRQSLLSTKLLLAVEMNLFIKIFQS